jgi:hypothetical protein
LKGVIKHDSSNRKADKGISNIRGISDVGCHAVDSCRYNIGLHSDNGEFSMTIQAIEKRIKEQEQLVREGYLCPSSQLKGIRFAIREMVEEIDNLSASRFCHLVKSDWLSLKERLMKIGEGK